ncbi:MAG: GNAT family N-acetyltransferase [Actinomycetota bacterium]|nr:GNAT family N-acetyltransferase [Actinomycetota bacterium]
MADLCTIDRATVEDHGELLTLQRAAFVDEAHLYGTPEVPALDETFAELDARLRRSHTIAARLDGRGRIVGAVSLRSDRVPPAIERLMVAPDQRGLGLATRLMAGIEAVARQDGHREVRLVVGEIASGNRRLYERLGYRYLERSVVFGDVGVWTMAKALPA